MTSIVFWLLYFRLSLAWLYERPVIKKQLLDVLIANNAWFRSGYNVADVIQSLLYYVFKTLDYGLMITHVLLLKLHLQQSIYKP